MVITSSQKIIFNVTAMSIVILVILLLVILPTVKSIKKMADETYKLREYLEKQYQHSLRVRLTKQKIEQIKLETASFSSHLFRVNDTLEFIQTLELTASKNKVAQSINSSDLDKISATNSANLSITVSGGYDNVLKYLHDIESLNYFLNPKQIRITPAYNREGEATQQVNLNLTIGLYATN